MKQYRVAEIFGPTIQGEGRHIGAPCHFVRFGGCDFRCTWCDTPHAVLPDLVAQLEQMDAWRIVSNLAKLNGSPDWIVLSGGNPGLLDLQFLVDLLHQRHNKVMVETQGSTYRSWYLDVDDLCFSPKPPSSGNPTDIADFSRVLSKYFEYEGSEKAYLKVVVFNDEDYEYAVEMHSMFAQMDFFVSVGNEDPSLPTVGNPHPKFTNPVLTRDIVLDKLTWLMDKVRQDPRMTKARVLPQLHTLAWGNARGR